MIDPVALAYRRLALAVLAQAWRDAHNQNGARAAAELGLPPEVTLAGDARDWLQGDGARWLVLALDLDAATAAHLDRALQRLAG
jgi:hypothetical protein